jgi:hypothetical protein
MINERREPTWHNAVEFHQLACEAEKSGLTLEITSKINR